MKTESMAHLAPAGHVVRANADATREVRRKVGRFRESRATKILRATLGALSEFSPAFAANVGYRLLATPPRLAERPWQRALRHNACRSRLRVGGGAVAVYAWGHLARPTILMVHGWGARATHMGRMIEPLVAAGFRVVSFDAPAHGHSDRRRTDLVEFAGAVHAVATFAGPLHGVIAHSFGAAMALLAARDWGVGANRHVLISAFDHCRWFCDAFGRYAGLTPEVIERMKQMMVERNNGRFDWQRSSVVEMLRSTKRPALLIHDQEDAEIPFAHSVALLHGAPNADLHATRGLGHHRLLADRSVIDRVVRFVSAD